MVKFERFCLDCFTTSSSSEMDFLDLFVVFISVVSDSRYLVSGDPGTKTVKIGNIKRGGVTIKILSVAQERWGASGDVGEIEFGGQVWPGLGSS